jgi:hypothetical protein
MGHLCLPPAFSIPWQHSSSRSSSKTVLDLSRAAEVGEKYMNTIEKIAGLVRSKDPSIP